MQLHKGRIAELEDKVNKQQILVASLQNIVELSVVGILILDDRQRIVFLNNTACMMLGLEKDELHGELFGMPVVPGKYIEIAFIKKDNQLGRAEMQVVESTYLGQDVHIISLHDITDRKRLENYEIQLQLYDKQYCTVPEFLEIVVEKSVKLTGSEAGFLVFLDKVDNLKDATHAFSESVIEKLGLDGQDSEFPERYLEELWDETMRNQEAVIINNLTVLPPPDDASLAKKLPVNRMMKIPVMENDRIVAMVGIANKIDPYDETDVQNIRLLMKNALGILQRKSAEEEKSRLIHNLGERVKELKCLYSVTVLLGDKSIRFDEALQKIVNLVSSSWQYPDITCARIKINEKVYKTSNFRRTDWCQAQNIIVNDNAIGVLEVFYLDERPDSDEGPFLKEECELLVDIADRLGKRIEQKEAERSKENLETRLQQVHKMDALGKLAGGISHDFNNMLGVITGYAELLEMALTDRPKLAKYAHQIHHAGDRGIRLTRKLLSFSKNTESRATRIDLNALLIEQQHMLEKTLTARIRLVLELADNLWPVWLDKSDMEDAILNISINAMHAIEGNGKLTFQTRNESLSELDVQQLVIKAGDYVMLSIIDNGCGMDKSTKQRIFDPFYSTKGDKGTGLGLSQVYGFVNRSHGAIKVYSEVGHGTQFVFYFPRYERTGHENLLPKDHDVSNLKGSESILIVDDEPALLDLSREILRQQGYTIFCAENGRQALKILEMEHIDLLFSDVIMPEMDGYQLASIVRQKYLGIKIQLTSGFSDNRHVKAVDSTLHKHLLQKPYNAKTLLKTIRLLLKKNE